MSDIVDRARQALEDYSGHVSTPVASLVPDLVAEIEQLRDEVFWWRAEFPDHGYQGGTDG